MSDENKIQQGNSVLLYHADTNKFAEGKIASISGNKAVIVSDKKEYSFSVAVTYSMKEGRKHYNLICTEDTSLKCFTTEKEYQHYLQMMKENQENGAKYSFVSRNPQYAYAANYKK